MLFSPFPFLEDDPSTFVGAPQEKPISRKRNPVFGNLVSHMLRLMYGLFEHPMKTEKPQETPLRNSYGTTVSCTERDYVNLFGRKSTSKCFPVQPVDLWARLIRRCCGVPPWKVKKSFKMKPFT